MKTINTVVMVFAVTLLLAFSNCTSKSGQRARTTIQEYNDTLTIENMYHSTIVDVDTVPYYNAHNVEQGLLIIRKVSNYRNIKEKLSATRVVVDTVNLTIIKRIPFYD